MNKILLFGDFNTEFLIRHKLIPLAIGQPLQFKTLNSSTSYGCCITLLKQVVSSNNSRNSLTQQQLRSPFYYPAAGGDKNKVCCEQTL